MIQRKKGIEKQVKEEFAKARKEVEIRHCHNLYNRMADSHPTHNWHYMKLRDKDTKKYLLTVFVATFVAYIIPAVVLYLGHFMGIMLTICISLFNLSMALLAWLWAKSVRKEFLLKKQIILNKSCDVAFDRHYFLSCNQWGSLIFEPHSVCLVGDSQSPANLYPVCHLFFYFKKNQFQLSLTKPQKRIAL